MPSAYNSPAAEQDQDALPHRIGSRKKKKQSPLLTAPKAHPCSCMSRGGPLTDSWFEFQRAQGEGGSSAGSSICINHGGRAVETLRLTEKLSKREQEVKWVRYRTPCAQNVRHGSWKIRRYRMQIRHPSSHITSLRQGLSVGGRDGSEEGLCAHEDGGVLKRSWNMVHQMWRKGLKKGRRCRRRRREGKGREDWDGCKWNSPSRWGTRPHSRIIQMAATFGAMAAGLAHILSRLDQERGRRFWFRGCNLYESTNGRGHGTSSSPSSSSVWREQSSWAFWPVTWSLIAGDKATSIQRGHRSEHSPWTPSRRGMMACSGAHQAAGTLSTLGWHGMGLGGREGRGLTVSG